MTEQANSAEALKEAISIYQKTEAFLQHISTLLAKVLGEDFSTTTFLSQYDMLLQLVLFKTAAADGKISEEEARAIKEIPQHGDLMHLSAGLIGEKELTWEALPKLDYEDLAIISSGLADETPELFQNFFTPIAAIDHRQGNEDLFLAIANATHQIANDIAGVDGLAEDSERYGAYQAIMDELRLNYRKAASSFGGSAPNNING
jgi:uncharacterized tellurite resistance protein B-like protein